MSYAFVNEEEAMTRDELVALAKNPAIGISRRTLALELIQKFDRLCPSVLGIETGWSEK